MSEKLNSKRGFLGVCIAVLVALACLTFPFAFNVTWSQNANNAERTLTYTTNNLAWDTSAPTNENGTINLELFSASYEQQAESANGDDVVAPGISNAKTVCIANKSTAAIRYYATAYRTDSSIAKVQPVLAGGEETSTHYYPEGKTEKDVMLPVTQTGLLPANATSDVSVGWEWLFDESRYEDAIDTYVGNGSDNVTYELFVVAEEVQVATVSFNVNGGTPEIESQIVEVGTTATAPDAPTKEGYEFAGWYSDEALTQAFNFSTPIEGDTTLYAKWTEIPVYYNVTFNSNGGSDVPSQTVKAGEVAIEPKDPTKEGYTFEGWFADEALTTKFNFASPISADTTLWAKWTKDETPTPTPEPEPVNPDDNNSDDNNNSGNNNSNNTNNTSPFSWKQTTNTGTSSSAGTSTSAKAKGMTIPTTGDNTQFIVVFALAVAALLGVVVVAIAEAKRSRNDA